MVAGQSRVESTHTGMTGAGAAGSPAGGPGQGTCVPGAGTTPETVPAGGAPARPVVPRSVYPLVLLGVAAASQSGNIVRLAEAPPLVIAAWRLVLASLLLLPLAGRDLRALGALRPREWGLLGLAGLALAAHLVSWIAAVQLTTVANAAIFFAVNPVFTAGASHFIFGERLDRRLVAAIGLGLAGVLAIGWRDFHLDPDRLAGDGVALLCAVFFTVYFLLGKRLRRVLPSATYNSTLYGVAALCCIVALPLAGQSPLGYSGRTWLAFVLMALVPTVVGHSLLNHALRWLDAGRVSTVTLAEPLLAGAVAWLAWGEAVPWVSFVGYLLITGGVALVLGESFLGRRRRRRAASA